jgi:hypothetical protein
MKFKDLYKKTISYYPAEIDISDGQIFKKPTGFLSNNLRIAWNEAEVSSENDWEDLLIWNIYQMLHKKAWLLHESNMSKLMIVDSVIDLADLKKMFLEALHVEGYEDMLKEYLNTD